VVATPIGNLEDLSARAIRILGEADLIACEDTRHTGHLLSAHAIRTPALSYFEHNEEQRTPDLIERLIGGSTIALVTDAGTPAISDPGYRLVNAALDAGVKVVSIPGPSAAIAAVSIAGLGAGRFAFEGFLPQKDGPRRARLKALAKEERTMVFFESARRIAVTLEEMSEVFGTSRKAAIVREITKAFEETIRGTIAELHDRVAASEPRGEITLVVEGATEAHTAADANAAGVTVELLREAGLSLKQASAVMAKLTGASRRQIYQRSLRDREPE
jgi:16S rRNA (cytidine1402-2'-O)-methyltransferase